MAGPLTGYRVIEMAGLGPAQVAAMMLADMGADVIRVERVGAPELGLDLPSRFNVMNRGKRSIALDLKQEDDLATLLALLDEADALLEGYPGVMERLGLGPDILLARRRQLVFGRVTGWGQTGPWRTRPATTSTTSRSRASSRPSAQRTSHIRPSIF